jgi:hypothetical protein
MGERICPRPRGKDEGGKEMNFKSQICTTREQSERLLSLGLKKATADMCYRYVNTVKGEKKYELIVEAAWSQEVIDEYVRFGTKIGLFDNLVHPCGKPVTPLEARADVTKNDIPAWSLHRLMSMLTAKRKCLLIRVEADLYDVLIDRIEHEIKGDYFPKEYLV